MIFFFLILNWPALLIRIYLSLQTFWTVTVDVT